MIKLTKLKSFEMPVQKYYNQIYMRPNCLIVKSNTSDYEQKLKTFDDFERKRFHNDILDRT